MDDGAAAPQDLQELDPVVQARADNSCRMQLRHQTLHRKNRTNLEHLQACNELCQPDAKIWSNLSAA